MLAKPASTNPSEFFMGSYWEGPWHFMLTAFSGGATCWGSLFTVWRAKLDATNPSEFFMGSYWEGPWYFMSTTFSITSEFFMGSYWDCPWHFMSTTFSGGATCWGSLFTVWRAKLDAGGDDIHQSIWIFLGKLLERFLTIYVNYFFRWRHLLR